MKPIQTITVAAIVALAVSTGTFYYGHKTNAGSSPAASGNEVFNRVIVSGKIRAGYVNYPPGCIVDPKTKEVSGIFVEVLKKIGENTGLKVEYTEEVGWATLISGLDAGRYDIIGSPTWANSVRGKLTTLSKPVYFSGVGVWVRPGETRFTPGDNWASLNKAEIKIAAMDGSTPEKITKAMFPLATLVSYPDQTGEPQLFLDVVSGKADVFFAEPSQGLAFLKSNPGKVKNIAASNPIKIFPNVFVMKGGESRLKGLMDTAIDELENSGVVDKIIKRYEPGPNAFYRIAKPYRSE